MIHHNLLMATAIIASVLTSSCSDPTAPRQVVGAG